MSLCKVEKDFQTYKCCNSDNNNVDIAEDCEEQAIGFCFNPSSKNFIGTAGEVESLKKYPILYSKKCDQVVKDFLSGRRKFVSDQSQRQAQIKMSNALDTFCANSLVTSVINSNLEYTKAGDKLVPSGVTDPDMILRPTASQAAIFNIFGAGNSDFDPISPFFTDITKAKIKNQIGIRCDTDPSQTGVSGMIFISKSDASFTIQDSNYFSERGITDSSSFTVSYFDFLYSYFTNSTNLNSFDPSSNIKFMLRQSSPTNKNTEWYIYGEFDSSSYPIPYLNGNVMGYKLKNNSLYFSEEFGTTKDSVNQEISASNKVANPPGTDINLRECEFDIYVKFKKDPITKRTVDYTQIYLSRSGLDFTTTSTTDKISSKILLNPLPGYDGFVSLNSVYVGGYIFNICACHLKDSTYKTYSEFISKIYNAPNTNAVIEGSGANAQKCLYPMCSSSPFYSSDTSWNNPNVPSSLFTSGCKSNTCFQYISINGAENIDPSKTKIKIDQNCLSSTNTTTSDGSGNGSASPEEEKKKEEINNHKNVYIFASVGSVIVFLILLAGAALLFFGFN